MLILEVLTSDIHVKSQLSILLRELGYTVSFHDKIDSLENALVQNEAKRPILIDVFADVDHQALVARHQMNSHLRFIGFQFFTSGQDAAVHVNASFYATSIVLPLHAERAKLRLKNTLKPQLTQNGFFQRRRKTIPIPKGGGSLKTRPPFSFQKPKNIPTETTQRFPRYLVCESAASLDLLSRIRARGIGKVACLLLGEDGAEFELVCREVNFQTVDDKTPLHMVRPDDLCIDELGKLERIAKRDQTVLHVYVGRTDDYSAEALSQLGLFIEFLDNLRNPHLRIYLAHAYGSEGTFREGVEEVFNKVVAKMPRMEIPNLRERAEDIPVICRTAIGMLRAAHPFLFVQHITNEAIDYLVSTREDLSHRKLIRILRNSLSLSQKTVLGVEDVKNYGESDLTTQHLLESMADENFFPAEEEQTVNF